MEVVGPDACTPTPTGAAVTVGAYDGVHLGHRAVIGRLRARAQAAGLETAVVTFDRHPATVVRPQSAPRTLTDLPQKLELLADAGVDRTLVIPFDQARSNETAEDFVTSVLVGALGARLVVVGRDFHFGHGRKGDVALLTELGDDLGFAVEPIDLFEGAGGAVISSTRIRELIDAGAVDEAAAMLGRPHQVRGPVVRGAGRGGAMLGFPTANLAVPVDVALPAHGVYAGRFSTAELTGHPAAISVGPPPSFDVDDVLPIVEAYLLDFSGDLYGVPATLSFTARLHAQEAYDDLDDLVAQMHRDVSEVDRLLSG
jgi:riboflavin kinase / FMN adenylyltransferase